MKQCTTCKTEKTEIEFYQRKSSKDGYQAQCKACDHARCKKWKDANREHVRTTSKLWYDDNRQRNREACVAWQEANPKHWAYLTQVANATKRGIPVLITLEEWIEFWGDDFDKRGQSATDLVMGRYGDAGAYEIGNIYKCTRAENTAGPRLKQGI